jgi:hypothetical protein
MLSGSYDPPIITEEAGLFDTLPQLVNMLDNILEFLKKHDINEGNPACLFVVGWVARFARHSLANLRKVRGTS